MRLMPSPTEAATPTGFPDRSVRTRIKICGVSQEADVDAAVMAGADAIGLVFYAKSPRCLALARASELARALPPFDAPVALFVNPAKAEVEAVCAAIPQVLLQFHGDETAAFCASFRRPYVRAIRVSNRAGLLDSARQHPHAQAILFDADVEGFGGGGKVFDWSLIPSDVPHPVVLSGGLHAGNVIRGIQAVRPWAVDVSSGVESARGIKDADKIRQFCEAVREADARRASAEA
jgi:phosphoribosylanthranilate isomerase